LFTTFSTFTAITLLYPFYKATIEFMPKRLITLLYNTNQLGLYDCVMKITAAILLGPEYLAKKVSDEKKTNIILEYLKFENSAPDPFISKYLEETSFLPEVKK